MTPSRGRPDSAVITAMLAAAAVTGQFVAGKAARDALYLANLPVTSLPAMVIATALFSILLVFASSRVLRRLAPATFVPLTFAVNALLLFAEWALLPAAPTTAARVVYLQISGVGPMLGSGFWLIATERFDPRTAKARFGQIAGAGTLGGLMGGLLAERVAAVLGMASMLAVLAVLSLCCAWLIRRLARMPAAGGPVEISAELSAEPAQSGLRVLATAPYLRHLAALVVLGTTGAVFIDYVFKAQAVETLGRGDGLLRFFAVYYAGVSMVTFVVQASASRLALEKLGLAATASSPSLALLAGGIGALAAPGLQGAMVARGGESVFRGSLFRSGYELFYTPIPAREKRAAKSIIDVGFDRLGDAVGGGVIQIALVLPLARPYETILVLAVACAAAAVVVASRLNRGYVKTLERSLMKRAVELDLSEVQDTTMRTTMLRALAPLAELRTPPAEASPGGPERQAARPAVANFARSLDPDVLQILALRSRERDRVIRVLQSDTRSAGSLVPHIIPLLAWDPVAKDAVKALTHVAEEHVGQLIDALLDPNQDFAVRRRLARVFSVCSSQRAVDGLILGLDDLRFEVRFHCARSLRRVRDRNPGVRIGRDAIFEIVRREAAVGRPVWESQRLLNRADDEEENVFVDEFIKDRASRSLAHVFTLLSLVLPAEPLQIAFRGLHTDDQNLRGTALEYLEGMMPASIRDPLWPFLEDNRPDRRVQRPRDEILADLMRSHQSIAINLRELKRRGNAARAAGKGPGEPWRTA